MRTAYLALVTLCSLGIGGYSLAEVLFAADTPRRESVPGLYQDPNWSRFQDPEENQNQILWHGPGWYNGSWYENEKDYDRGKTTDPTKKSPKKQTSNAPNS